MQQPKFWDTVLSSETLGEASEQVAELHEQNLVSRGILQYCTRVWQGFPKYEKKPNVHHIFCAYITDCVLVYGEQEFNANHDKNQEDNAKTIREMYKFFDTLSTEQILSFLDRYRKRGLAYRYCRAMFRCTIDYFSDKYDEATEQYLDFLVGKVKAGYLPPYILAEGLGKMLSVCSNSEKVICKLRSYGDSEVVVDNLTAVDNFLSTRVSHDRKCQVGLELIVAAGVSEDLLLSVVNKHRATYLSPEYLLTSILMLDTHAIVESVHVSLKRQYTTSAARAVRAVITVCNEPWESYSATTYSEEREAIRRLIDIYGKI